MSFGLENCICTWERPPRDQPIRDRQIITPNTDCPCHKPGGTASFQLLGLVLPFNTLSALLQGTWRASACGEANTRGGTLAAQNPVTMVDLLGVQVQLWLLKDKDVGGPGAWCCGALTHAAHHRRCL